jgi:hypothetical protein
MILVRFKFLTAASIRLLSGMLRYVISQKLTDVSEVLIASSIALMIQAVSTSEAPGSFCETARRNIPEESHLLNGFSMKLPLLPHQCMCDAVKTTLGGRARTDTLLKYHEVVAVYTSLYLSV